MATLLKIYSNDSNDQSYDIYVNGELAINVPKNSLIDGDNTLLIDANDSVIETTEG